MTRLILIIAIGAVFYILLRQTRSLPPHKRRAQYLKLLFATAIFAVVILTLMGKMHWLGAALTATLVFLRQMMPLLLRHFPSLLALLERKKDQQQQSTVKTRMLQIQVNTATGEMAGEVLEGEFKGWYLSELQAEQLDALMQFCEQHDANSAQLLASYMQQRFSQNANHSSTAPVNTTQMSRADALAALGLQEGASEQEIVMAHRKLMQRLHPDRGGNDFLAAQINLAKEVLLQSKSE